MSFINKVFKKKLKAPWAKYYTKKEMNLKIPNQSIYEFLKDSCEEHPNAIALSYFGKNLTFKELIKKVDKCARAFRSQGIKSGDVITICMPNTPETFICFYAINKIGAISNFIHPLSGEKEIEHYLVTTNSIMLVMIDMCYEKIKDIIADTNVYKTIVVSAKDSMPFFTSVGYIVTRGYKIKKPARSEEYLYWHDFMHKADSYRREYKVDIDKDNPAVILHSGGTTGNPKGIVISNGGFNAIPLQGGIAMKEIGVGDKSLAIMPNFHGFGLSIGIHTLLCLGVTLEVIPQFDARKFDKLLEKHNPSILLGVPTLYEALTKIKNDKLDLTNVSIVISGGDSLSNSLSRRVNAYLKEHGSNAGIIQGYGMTESLAATCLGWGKTHKEGSMGVPLPGNYFKIVTPETQDEVPFNTDGEICVTGPTLMLGYLNNERETNDVLQIHKDGHLWLHTGDMGRMDEDGALFYTQRLKRMIISSGYNVYPAYIEQIIEEHEAVLNCTVVGIPHPYKGEVAKAYIVLKNDVSKMFIKGKILEHCEKHLSKFSVPAEFEFRDSLPKTLIGKIDFRKLQEEHTKGTKKDEQEEE